MISYSFYSKVSRYIKRNLFRLIFSHTFKSFGKKASIIDPDIIEGEQYMTLGDYASINSKAWILALKQNNIEPHLIIEDGVRIGRFSHIVALRSVVIKKNVLIADKVYISDNLHGYEDINQPIINQPILFKNSVEIGENSWIGENVSIIGASIGKHCVIGANSVVTRNIPDYSVAIGSPAKVIKRYNSDTKLWINNDIK
jgi:acetyltransferase-like isoleucine patch superfamily enzyme